MISQHKHTHCIQEDDRTFLFEPVRELFIESDRDLLRLDLLDDWDCVLFFRLIFSDALDRRGVTVLGAGVLLTLSVNGCNGISSMRSLCHNVQQSSWSKRPFRHRGVRQILHSTVVAYPYRGWSSSVGHFMQHIIHLNRLRSGISLGSWTNLFVGHVPRLAASR